MTCIICHENAIKGGEWICCHCWKKMKIENRRKKNIERDLNVYYAENQFKIQNIMGKSKLKEEVK